MIVLFTAEALAKLFAEVLPDTSDPLAGGGAFRKSLAVNLFYRVNFAQIVTFLLKYVRFTGAVLCQRLTI